VSSLKLESLDGVKKVVSKFVKMDGKIIEASLYTFRNGIGYKNGIIYDIFCQRVWEIRPRINLVKDFAELHNVIYVCRDLRDTIIQITYKLKQKLYWLIFNIHICI